MIDYTSILVGVGFLFGLGIVIYFLASAGARWFKMIKHGKEYVIAEEKGRNRREKENDRATDSVSEVRCTERTG